MPPKIKFIIGSLAIVAIGILAVGMSFLRTNFSNKSSLAAIGSDKLAAVDSDSDKDGLDDVEESYWNTDFQNPDSDGDGFLDGEEVASGHDPLKPGPDDLLAQTNLTEKVTDLLIGGLYSGDLKLTAENATFDSAVNDLSLAAISEFYDPKSISKPPVFRTVTTTVEVQEIYLNKIAEIIKQNLFSENLKIDPQPLSDMKRQRELFLSISGRFGKTREELITMDVPQNWKSFHATLIGVISRLQNDYGALGNYERDPIRAMIAVNEIATVMGGEVKSVIQDLRNELNKQKLSPNNVFYEVLMLVSF